MKKLKIEHAKAFTVKEVIFLIITTCVVSLTMGLSINLNKDKEIKEDTTQDKYLTELIENYNLITSNYYENIDKSKLLSSAIEGMVSSLGDTHSVTIAENATSNFNIRLTGSYSGLGVEIVNGNDNNIVVYQVLSSSPAEKAGILSGDIIKNIDGVVYSSTKELSSYIANSKKVSFDILILRNGENKTIKVSRDVIVLKSIYSEVINKGDKKVGYIYISLFAENTADQFIDAVSSLEKQNIDSLIIDVRDNSGGHLTSAVKMLSCLFDSNKVIYQIELKGKKTKYYSTGDKTKKYPIVVLQNSNSASASELLSSALKEQYKATIIGETSYGKGTVQELRTLSNGTEYKFTTKKWLTPNGNWIDGTGVIPDIEVKLDQAYTDNPSNDTDNQLQTALNYISNL